MQIEAAWGHEVARESYADSSEAGRSGVEVSLAEGPGVNDTIAIENPRCLAISVRLLGGRTLFASARVRTQVRLWWSTFAEELAAAARGQHVVMLLDANASFNEDAGIHCGGSEASKENTQRARP